MARTDQRTNLIKGTATNDSATAGYVGEYVESVIGSTTLPLSGQYGDLTSITLTAGDWDVTAVCTFLRNSASYTTFDFIIGISTTSGNNSTGLVAGSNSQETQLSGTGFNFTQLALDVPSYRISVSGSLTVYLKAYPGSYSSGTPKGIGRLSARRVR